MPDLLRHTQYTCTGSIERTPKSFGYQGCDRLASTARHLDTLTHRLDPKAQKHTETLSIDTRSASTAGGAPRSGYRIARLLSARRVRFGILPLFS